MNNGDTADAAASNIEDGDAIVVFNDRGETRGVEDVSEHVMKGVVVLENGWSESFGGSSSSCVSNDAADALVSGQSNNSTLVNVRRA